MSLDDLMSRLDVGQCVVINVRANAATVRRLRERELFVYVGRYSPAFGSSAWRNPFAIGRDGDRAEVIARYREHLLGRIDLMARLPELRGKALGCWCAPEPCHADVLAALVGQGVQSWL